jgi:hypothetical protein
MRLPRKGPKSVRAALCLLSITFVLAPLIAAGTAAGNRPSGAHHEGFAAVFTGRLSRALSVGHRILSSRDEVVGLLGAEI